jgi:hypothetical protein
MLLMLLPIAVLNAPHLHARAPYRSAIPAREGLHTRNIRPQYGDFIVLPGEPESLPPSIPSDDSGLNATTPLTPPDGGDADTTSNGGDNDGMCIIATVTFGSELAPEVEFLRSFRDNLILSTRTGSSFYVAFDAFYYSWSTPVAQFIDENPVLKLCIKIILYPLIGILQGTALLVTPLFNVFPEIGAVTAGFLASSLIGIFYIAPWLTVIHLLKRRRASTLTIHDRVLKMTCGVVVLAIALMFISYHTMNAPLTTLVTSVYVLACLVLASLGVFEMVRRKLMITST